MQENWKELPINHKYEVSDHGNVRKKITKRRPYRYLKGEYGPHGHRRILVIVGGKPKRFLLHRLIAELFIDNPNNYPVINHIDGDPTNNHISNLEWCTNGHNLAHAYKLKRRSAVGSNNNLSKLSEDDVLRIRELSKCTILHHREIAKIFNVSTSLITMVINRKIWTHV